MSDPFIGEIVIFAGNFAVRNYAFCDGQLLPIAQNTALFSLLGTTYGGDGRTTLALPNLQGRVPMHPGQGPGLSDYRLGQAAGTESVALTAVNLPSHTHEAQCAQEDATSTNPGGNAFAIADNSHYADTGTQVDMAPGVLEQDSAAAHHNNNQPYLALNFLIALQGTYPSRS